MGVITLIVITKHCTVNKKKKIFELLEELINVLKTFGFLEELVNVLKTVWDQHQIIFQNEQKK